MSALKKHRPSPVDLLTVVFGKGKQLGYQGLRGDPLGTENRNGPSDSGVWGETCGIGEVEARQLFALGRDRTRLVVDIFAKNTTTLILKDGSSLLMPFPVCYKSIMTVIITSSDIRGIIVC